MRQSRTLVVSILVAAVSLAACGDDRTDSLDTSTTAVASATTASATATTTPVATTVAATAPREVGDCDATEESETGKPVVCLPAELPAALGVTDIIEGEGPEAKVGDVLVMNYVGVRSEDGAEFDNSFDRGSTFPLVLGVSSVIQGWHEGLVGIKQGGRRQLDIPAELAYGDQPPDGDVIGPGDALSFVVEAVQVISAPDPAERPDVTVDGGANVSQVKFDDLVEGEGPDLELGETAVVFLVAYRADTGEELLSSWDDGQLVQLGYNPDPTTLQGLVTGMTGMKTGGRRLITIPYDLAFGADGNPGLGPNGLPAATDLVMLIDLVGSYTP